MQDASTHDHPPALRGGLTALAAALLFGISTPLLQRAGAGQGAFSTAALLYLGAALVGALLHAPVEHEARVRRADAPRLLLMALFGAAIGPVALAWGLQHTGAGSASLMLTLEAVFTALLAWLWYRETLDRRVLLALLLMTAGGMLLVADSAALGSAQLLGLLAVVVATLAWALDNSLSRALAERDPAQVVMLKCAAGAVATALLAWAVGESLPRWPQLLALLAIGATGYGLSLRLYLLAQRAFGAARTASVFAAAPFIGLAFAIALGERSGGPWLFAGGAMMLAGVMLHLAERHAHAHRHEPLAHEHAHHHDDGHHTHRHDPPFAGGHSHPHVHTPVQHAHAHVPDAHHGHRH